MLHVETEREGEERGGKVSLKRMSARNGGAKERQQIKKAFPAERKENHSAPHHQERCAL